MRIEVTIKPWPNRADPGVVRLICPDRGVILEARCLAKADNAAAAKAGNPTRNPLFRMGDLPAGEYIAYLEPAPQTPVRTYGPHGKLRPTNGCNRVDDETEEATVAEMDKAGLTQIPYSVREDN